MCTVNRDLWEPFFTEQGLLNAAMYAPMGFFGALATRRVLFVVGLGTLLTVTIETTQGALRVLGRGCDTSDVVMNTAGLCVGILIAVLMLAVRQIDDVRFLAVTRRESYAALGVFATLVMTFSLVGITPDVVNGTLAVKQASGAQQQAIESAVHEYFGDHYEIKSVQFFSGGPGGSGTVMAAFPTGFVEMNWPDKEKLTASLTTSTDELSNGYPLDDPVSDTFDESDARRLASRYAKKHAAWGTADSHVSVFPVGKRAELGWMFSWRRYRAGVLMPMRLDIQIGPSGRISQLTADPVPDPTVPAVSISRDQALDALFTTIRFKEIFQDTVATKTAELMAVSEHGQWRAVWRISVSGEEKNALAYVDATSRKIWTYSVTPIR